MSLQKWTCFSIWAFIVPIFAFFAFFIVIASYFIRRKMGFDLPLSTAFLDHFLEDMPCTKLHNRALSNRLNVDCRDY
jgi:hypothetical protein